jgi:beta-lactamase class D
MKKILLYSLFFLTFDSFGQKIDTVNLQAYFDEHTGGFSVYNLKTGSYIQYNIEHCKKRFSPCSTFKIPNSLIGLETGVIPDTGYIIKYDSVVHPKNAEMLAREPFKYWFQDLSLKRAFKYSCVWYYQELARRVGQEKMGKYINFIDYGNKDISSGIDKFWLCGSIEISINEQIDFLKKFYLRKLDGFSDKTIEAVKSIMLYDTTPDYKLYGKTGGGNCWDNKAIGWYVGFVETDSGTNIFAMNIIVNNLDDLNNNYRIELTKKILRNLKIIK